MRRVAFGFLLLAALVAAVGALRASTVDMEPAGEPSPWQRQFPFTLTLSTGQTVVINEGAGEPRSIGSYSIRVYRPSDPAFPLDQYCCGLILNRTGFLEGVQLVELAESSIPMLSVVQRSAGSGHYLSADLFEISADGVVIRARVQDLQPDADLAAVLAWRLCQREQAKAPGADCDRTTLRLSESQPAN